MSMAEGVPCLQDVSVFGSTQKCKAPIADLLYEILEAKAWGLLPQKTLDSKFGFGLAVGCSDVKPPQFSSKLTK